MGNKNILLIKFKEKTLSVEKQLTKKKVKRYNYFVKRVSKIISNKIMRFNNLK